MHTHRFDDVTAPPANDAQLVQRVRGALGRKFRGVPRVNVSSCSFVVTLHGKVESPEQRAGIEAVVREVPGVFGVVNRIRVLPPAHDP